MNILYKALFCAAAIVAVAHDGAADSSEADKRYRSARIETLAVATGISAMTDTLADGDYIGAFEWHRFPLSVRVSDGETAHVGIQLFTDQTREVVGYTQVVDFLERYLLEYHLKIAYSTIDKELANGITIEHGRMGDLHNVLGDTASVFSLTLKDGRRYTAEWERDNKPVFRMSFPAAYRLLGGYEFDEATRRLPRRLELADTTVRCSSAVELSVLEKCDSAAGDYYVAKGDYCVLEVINNDRYYFVSDSLPKLVYSPLYPVESIANLLTTGEICNRFTAAVKMRVYGGETIELELPLNSLINYFIKEGCKPYFGLKGVYPLRDKITALFEMVNADTGYEHLMSVSFDTRTLPAKEGTIDIKLTPYIPLHDIKSRFGR